MTGLNPLDGDAVPAPHVGEGIESLRLCASDPAQPLEERLEAFEDIFDSEVGDTSLTRARNIEREVGLRQLYLKFEGGNPTGTQKDRIAFAQVLDALRRGYDGLTVATCGNYGAAVALAASLAGLRSVILVPEAFHSSRLGEMEALGAEIRRSRGGYEDAVQHSMSLAEEGGLYDANPGGDNTSLQLTAYGEIANEIYDELRDAPAVVAVPASNGTTLAGIHKGFVRLFRRGKTSRVPRIIAGSSFHKNPIVRGFIRGAATCEDLAPERILETRVNEPLINWHSIDGDLALEALRSSNGWAAEISDRRMVATAALLRKEQGLNVLPAATAGLEALLDLQRKSPLPGDRYVAILTGRRA